LTDGEFLIEEDGLGEVRVPANRLWGAQTHPTKVGYTLRAETPILCSAVV
jgi:fumarate hydratase class II